jgi:type II secretory ATPase GspE/PulE/Tfp pilus assembly ATPase PilB-like protein
MHLAITPESAGKKGFALEALGLHGEALSSLHQALARAEGLILVSSPAGEGKTTTLYSLADAASHASRLTASVEERVLLPLPQVTQVEVKHELGATVASTLKAAL